MVLAPSWQKRPSAVRLRGGARLHLPAAQPPLQGKHADAVGRLHPGHRLWMRRDPGITCLAALSARSREPGKHQLRLHVLVIDAERASAVASRIGKKCQCIIVDPEASILTCCRRLVEPGETLQIRRRESRVARPQCIACGNDRVVAQAVCDHQRIRLGGCDGGECPA